MKVLRHAPAAIPCARSEAASYRHDKRRLGLEAELAAGAREVRPEVRVDPRLDVGQQIVEVPFVRS